MSRRCGMRASLVTAILLGSTALGAQQSDGGGRPTRERTLYEDLQLFSGVLNQIRVNHPDTSITSHELIMAAIRGMVQAADPYSAVFPATRLSEAKQKAWRDGKLVPVGVDFSYVSGAPVVVSVTPGSSASRQDILRGDELIAADGEPILAESAEELDLTLAGEKNSKVKLTFERRRADGTLVQFDRTVKREWGDDQTAVPVAFMLDHQTGYVRIVTFDNEKVADDLHDALGQLEKQGMERLVLDIRDNGGGYIGQAATIAGEFLPKGTIVYTTVGRKAEVSKDTGRVGRSFWQHEKRYPMVLMINGGTASASELVAGALQDHDRALIVGQPSHGKALVMLNFPIYDGGAFLSTIYLNIGQLRTPCGRTVQRQFRGLRREDYYRRAYADRDTVGRPSCKTDGGRTVYGGGGIVPDVRLPREDYVPLWMSRVREEALPLEWVAGHITANASAYGSLDSLLAHPVLAGNGLSAFRAFATAQGVTIPEGAKADSALQRLLVDEVAYTKWGTAGFYRMEAVLDPEIAAGVRAFDRAKAILAAN